jgi:hypothetical protein
MTIPTQLTIIRADNYVRINGRGLTIDCSSLDPNIHAIQWADTSGWIEYIAPPSDQNITDLSPYQAIIDAWTAAANAIDNPPPPPPPTLSQAQAAKIASLRAACSLHIVSGFQSSALGSAYFYPSDPTSQTNLSGSVVSSLLPNLAVNWTTPFWCSPDGTNWIFAQHTVAQIQQVGSDIKAMVVAAQTQLATLTAQVLAATDVATVDAISWS